VYSAFLLIGLWAVANAVVPKLDFKRTSPDYLIDNSQGGDKIKQNKFKNDS
jgi:hypothetical protein